MKVKKILVSQPEPQSGKSPYFDIAERYGVEFIFRPFIKIEGLTAKEFRQSKTNLADFTAVIFSAKTAVDNYFRLMEESRVPIVNTHKYFCTTESLALYLQKYIVYRKRKIFFGTSGKMTDPQLMAAIVKNHKERFLLPVSDIHREKTDDTEALDNAGINYTKAVMYRTVSNDFGPDEKLNCDMIIFFSPAGIGSLQKNFPDFDQKKNGIKIGCYGAATAQAVKEANLTLNIEAPTTEYTSMPAALEAYLKAEKE